MHTASAGVSQSTRRRFFFLYALIAYAVSWAIEIPLALKAQGVITGDVPFSLHYLAAFGPFIAGIIVTWRESGSAGCRELAGRLVRWRVDSVWWVVAVSPVLAFLLLSAILRVVGGTWLDIGMLGRVDFLPDLGIGAVFLWLATYGFGEETGWRGYLLPRLQRDRSAWSATVVLGLIWAIWHIPSFFYLHTAPNAGSLVGFLLGVFAGAVFLTWLYNSTGGSVLIVAVWHGLFDYVTACTECKSGLIAAAVSTLVMVWAVAVVLLYGRVNLSRKGKQTL